MSVAAFRSPCTGWRGHGLQPSWSPVCRPSLPACIPHMVTRSRALLLCKEGPWTQGQVCFNPGNIPTTAVQDEAHRSLRMGPPPTSLACENELLLELLLGQEKECGETCVLAAQLSILATSPVVWLFPHTGGSPCGLWCLSVAFALNLGKLVQCKCNCQG